MEFPNPIKNKFTVYSKSGCINCIKVKQFLLEKQLLLEVINCDDFMFDCKLDFLQFISDISGKEVNTFPMVFDGTTFIGGFLDTQTYVNKTFLNFDLTF
jgi:glutaredoxin